MRSKMKIWMPSAFLLCWPAMPVRLTVDTAPSVGAARRQAVPKSADNPASKQSALETAGEDACKPVQFLDRIPLAPTEPEELEEFCRPINGSRADLCARIKPCGTYAACGIPWERVLDANVVYPRNHSAHSTSRFNMQPHQTYLVRFDIGTHPKINISGLSSGIDAGLPIVGRQEVCVEGVMKMDDDWGTLGGQAQGIDTSLMRNCEYHCMGRCGPGCQLATGCRVPSGWFGSSWAYFTFGANCAKHDLCAAYKSALRGDKVSGFCNDIDCGDEASQAVTNCKAHTGHPDQCDCEGVSTTAIEDMFVANAPTMIFDPGNCPEYRGCDKGQGLQVEVQSYHIGDSVRHALDRDSVKSWLAAPTKLGKTVAGATFGYFR